jgi:hypothetical protein
MKEVDKFCQKYDAYVRESSRMHRRLKPVSYAVCSDSDPEIFETMPITEVKCVEVHMPEDRFRALLEHDKWLYDARTSNYIIGNEAVYIVEQHDRETRIRHENPAAKIAYDKYQNILRLVDSHYR